MCTLIHGTRVWVCILDNVYPSGTWCFCVFLLLSCKFLEIFIINIVRDIDTVGVMSCWARSNAWYSLVTAVCQPQCKHGECVGPNKCKCHPGYAGKTCNQGRGQCDTREESGAPSLPAWCKNVELSCPATFLWLLFYMFELPFAERYKYNNGTSFKVYFMEGQLNEFHPHIYC